MAPSTRENVTLSENGQSGESSKSSLIIVILSLLFVAIFGCALVGGVISGDPNNGFLITIIVASSIAISLAMGVSIRYIYVNRTQKDDDDRYLSKENMRGTLPSTDEENQDNEEPPHDQNHNYYYPNAAGIESEIKEIQTKSVFGEISVLSPHSIDDETLSLRHHIIRDRKRDRQGFDFSRITSGENGENIRMREDPPEDPPEGIGLANVQTALVTRGTSQDPSAPKFSTDGDIIGDESENQIQNHREQNDNKSHVSEKSGIPENNVDDGNSSTIQTRRRSRSKSKSPSASRSAKSPSNSIAMTLPSRRIKKEKKNRTLSIPSSTKSAPINSSFPFKSPATPAASEVGSVASSFFNIFGKSKKPSSDAGAHDAVSSNKSTAQPNKQKENVTIGKPPMVRPPMLPPTNRKGREALNTIDGQPAPPPPTPGSRSSFTIPPPRPIPRTPMGSEVFSEFQSVAGSAAASSTFDPEAHQKALEKMRKNQMPIGAKPIDDNSMPMYYNDDDDDEKDNSVAPSSVIESTALSYDVFAPPGALGIVVDTTEKGCIVYSLKKSSPMQGLMSKGDLIIGLDNFDVRNMNASSLTKLMAKKSEQAERKFTLLPVDS